MADTYRTFRVGIATDGDESVGSVGGAAFYIAALNTLQATMVGVGTGDNSANVTTMGTDVTALITRFNAFVGAPASNLTSPAVLVHLNNTLCPTLSVLRMYLNQVLLNAAAAGMSP